jgi:hypothetical protein
MATEIMYPEHVRLWNEGLSFTDIAVALDETRGSVAGKLHRMKGRVELRQGYAVKKEGADNVA